MNDKDFNELLASVEEAGKIKNKRLDASRIYDYPEPNAQLIREKIGFTQSKFASLIGVSPRTLQNWEQGHRKPTGPARVLLRLVQSDPMSVFKVLHLK